MSASIAEVPGRREKRIDTPSPQLAMLLRWLAARAARGLAIPSLDGITSELGIAERSHTQDLLREGVALGLIRVRRGTNGIAAIEAADGSWCARRDLKPALAERPCLRCRKPFGPAHRHNFLCVHCQRINGFSASLAP